MNIYYVCTGNSFRSPLAEALTNKYLQNFEARSGGTNPAQNIAANAQELISQDNGLKFIKNKPEPISIKNMRWADEIIGMEREHTEIIEKNYPDMKDKIRIWNIADPIRPEIEAGAVYKKIKSRVIQLKKK